MRAAIINLSHPHYNLGAHKLATWLRSRGDEVVEFERDPGMFLVDFDLVCVSAIFSWDVAKGVEIAFIIRYDWTAEKLTHFARYFNRFYYKYTPLEEYRCRTKQPFAIVA